MTKISFAMMTMIILIAQSRSMGFRTMDGETEIQGLRHSRVAKFGANCHRTCKTCTGSDQFSCKSCYDDEELIVSQNPDNQKYGLSCFTNNQGCKEGTYYSFTQKRCLNCHVKCRTCGDSDEKSCYSCRKGNTIERWAGNKFICNYGTCPRGTYRDKGTGNCEKCDSTCGTCNASGPKKCQTCAKGLVFRTTLDYNYVSYTYCTKSGCMLGQYNNAKKMACETCHQSCHACSNARSNSCTECAPGYKLASKDGGKTCVKDSSSKISCSSSQFYDSSQKKCLNCDPLCKTCRALRSCSSCNQNFHIAWTRDKYGKHLNCKKSALPCKTNQFQDWDNQVCRDCHQICATCSGPNSSDCGTCAYGYKARLVNGKRICEKDPTVCRPGAFYDKNKKKCLECHQDCAECKGPENYSCESCKTGFVLINDYDQKLKIWKSACFDKSKNRDCPTGTYNDTKFSCKPCDTSCRTCKGPGYFNCLTCIDGKLTPTFNKFNGKTQNQCAGDSRCKPDEFYHAYKKKCLKCSPACKTCFHGNDNGCSSCHPGFKLTKSNLYNWACTASMELESVSKCHHSCKEGACSGPLEGDCHECGDGYRPDFYLAKGVVKRKCVAKESE